jgi:hypothetical protein
VAGAAAEAAAASDAGASERRSLLAGDALVGEVDASFGVDAGRLVGETVVERPIVVVTGLVGLVELGVLRHGEVVVFGRDVSAVSRAIVHAPSVCPSAADRTGFIVGRGAV